MKTKGTKGKSAVARWSRRSPSTPSLVSEDCGQSTDS
jgi:hypothetical protein